MSMEPSNPKADERPGGVQDIAAGAVLRLLDRPVSPEALAAGAEGAARPSEARNPGSMGVLLFRIAGEVMAVPAKLLRRTTLFAAPTPIPHRSSGVLRGLCNIRGELVLCADLRRLLGLAARETEATIDPTDDSRRMVIIGTADASWAFEVDALIGIDRIDPAGMVVPPMTVEHAIGAFVAGLSDIDGKRITILDGEQILEGFKAGLG